MATIKGLFINRREQLLALASLGTGMILPAHADPQSFENFIANLWPRAQAQGIGRETFEAATRNLAYDPRIAAHTQRQAEFTVPIWTYVTRVLSSSRIATGQRVYQDTRAVFARAAEIYGVSAGVILGIYGIESGFGTFAGRENVLNALATLGSLHYQGDFGAREFLAALQILENGDATPEDLLGSWAGAMGQPQFLPSSYLTYAVDFDGTGKRDIWHNRADVIGSIANFLHQKGWMAHLPWGLEVKIPHNFAYAPEYFEGQTRFATFAQNHVRPTHGRMLPKDGSARLYMPAGITGPIFLITHNFEIIKTYNRSNAYALTVGLLGDAIVQGQSLSTPWPIDMPWPSKDNVQALQTALKQRGFYQGDIDGRAGQNFERALRAFQFSEAMIPDGFASKRIMQHLLR